MRIAVVVGGFPVISETFILNHIAGLIDAGHEVVIYPSWPGQKKVSHKILEKYSLLRRVGTSLPTSVLARVYRALHFLCKDRAKNFKRLLVVLKKYKKDAWVKPLVITLVYEFLPYVAPQDFDVVHAHFGMIANRVVLCREFGLFKNATFVATFHGLDAHKYTKEYYRALVNMADIVTVNSRYTYDQVLGLGFAAAKIHIVPVSLDINYFKPMPKQQREVVRLISVGRLVAFKGSRQLLLALETLLKKYPEYVDRIVVQLIGDGPLRDELQNTIAVNGLQNIVQLEGAKPQEYILQALQAADIFVLPGIVDDEGRCENQGLVVQEAGAVGLPVIVSRVGGLAEGVQHAQTGFIVPPKDIEALMQAIKDLVDNPILRAQFGAAARAFVVSHYANEVITRKICGLYV